MNRDALLRIWFLFYVWTLVGDFFDESSHWRWVAWLGGSALTCWLLYRRSMLAGIVGYVVSGTAAFATLPTAFMDWGALFSGYYSLAAFARPHLDNPLFGLCYHTAMAFVPAVVLVLHVASRHRLQRSFEESVALRRRGRIIRPSGYYLVTLR